jgi:hypothetical protein
MNGAIKPIDPNKLELNRLRASKLQLTDSKKVISSQLNTDPLSRGMKVKNLNTSIASISNKIASLKVRLGIR